ncbi:MAG: polymer-forming cytoskeletal protein [Verrucomicrobia bacterium]|nr:polymer-forming cytoskeletal protein [Verrucomicrobiota bacterium]
MATTLTKVEIHCPECGQTQMESENFISTVCRNCGAYYKSVHAPGRSRRKVKRLKVKKRELACAECGALQEVAEEAQSSTCLACGRHLELGHREILGEHLGNLSLEGELVIWPKGNFGGSRARAARIVLHGRASGFLEAQERLRVEGQAKIRAGASGGILEIKAGASLECGDTLRFSEGQIDGELRCAIARFEGPLKVGPHGRVVAEKISFTELTVESGGQVHAQAETKTPR